MRKKIIKPVFYSILAIFVCAVAISCQEQNYSARRTTPPMLTESQPPTNGQPASSTEPTELADLQPAPTSAPTVKIIEQAAPVTYTWKAIETSQQTPTSAPAEPEAPEDAEANWEPTQPVVIFPDNINDRPGQTSQMQSTAVEYHLAEARHDVRTLEKDELVLFDKLQGKILELMLALRQAEEQNIRMQKNLLESRQAYNLTRDDLNRKLILIELQKTEIANLKNKLAKIQSPKKPTTQPATTQQGEDELDIAALRRRNKRLKDQLELANAKGPEQVRQISVKLAEMSERFSDMEDIHVRLSHLVVVQADQIKALQEERRQLQGMAMKDLSSEASLPDSTAKIIKARQTVITGVIKSIEGQKVVVNIGANSGLKKGKKMIVYRGDNFIGYLKLDEIGKNESAGTLVRQVISPKAGDKVVDRLN